MRQRQTVPYEFTVPEIALLNYFEPYLGQVRPTTYCPGGVTVGCQTYDRIVVGSIPGRDIIKWLLLGWVTANHLRI